MIDLSKKKVIIVDNGLFPGFARHIAPAFGHARYYVPWQSYAPCSEQIWIGAGFDEMERIRYPLHYVDDTDLWVFLDLYHSDLQVYLESKGARVWGPRDGEEMELYRWQFKEFLRRIGLPVQPCRRIEGFGSLYDYLHKGENKHIKTSFVRGDFETFRHVRYELSEPRLKEREQALLPFKDDYEFVVEDDISDAVEIGYDGFSVDGLFPSHAMMAYEVKDVGMIGTALPYEQLAEPVKMVNAKLAPAMKGYRYRGFLCTELRYTREKKAYLIDPCCRLGSPSNELLQGLFDEWPVALWEGAEGNLHSPRIRKRFAVAAVIHSEWAVDHPQAIYYPREIDPWVKLRFHCRRDGVDWLLPQPVGCPAPGVVIGVGDSLLNAIEHCRDNAAQVTGYGCEVSLDSIDEALRVIEKGKEFGITFTRDALPTVAQLERLKRREG